MCDDYEWKKTQNYSKTNKIHRRVLFKIVQKPVILAISLCKCDHILS